MTDSVTVIGASGALGYGLALRLGIAGTPIVIGSRDAGRAEETAGKLAGEVPDGSFQGFANGEATERSEVVFLCVPFRNQSETLTNLKEHLREGQLVVDATVPLAAAVSGRATRPRYPTRTCSSAATRRPTSSARWRSSSACQACAASTAGGSSSRASR